MINRLWCDDISFCPEKCDRKTCPRNQVNIRDRTIPHSYFVEIPPDCPKLEQKKAKPRKPDLDKVKQALKCIADGSHCEMCDYSDNAAGYEGCHKAIAQDALALLDEIGGKE